jgi:hypothetical protein
MVKVTGRTQDRAGLQAHLSYISRNAALPLEDRDGAALSSRQEAADKAEGWTLAAYSDSHRRSNTPISHSILLSMPAGTDPLKVRDAARAFADAVFASEHDYVFTLHTDTPRPHVHLAVCSRGDNGQRLNPRKADLEAWRQVFAQALRDRGVEAEASPRRARGVSRKSERGPLRRIRERAEAGRGKPARVVVNAYREAAKVAFGPQGPTPAWEDKLLARQARIRALYLAQAGGLKRSSRREDQTLGAALEAFVADLPAPDTQRLALARELSAANVRLAQREIGKTRER